MKPKRRVWGWMLLFAVVFTTAAVGALYTWTGADPGTDTWRSDQNWTTLICGIGVPCYPNTVNDDATIPVGTPPWTVDLTTETIDDLRIEESVDFGAADADPILNVDSLTIVGGAGPVTVTISGGAKIQTY